MNLWKGEIAEPTLFYKYENSKGLVHSKSWA